MKYLFFDIECANCFGGKNKICEIGYVLTDEQFNILKKDAIPISPGNKSNRNDRFDTTIYEREKGFQWAYDFETYFACEKFPHFYSSLKNLFEDPETLIFGHSVNNDIRYLGSEFDRYKLKPYIFTAHDTQIIMKYYSSKHEKFMSLRQAFIKLCGRQEIVQLDPHLSMDDAKMTMRVIQEICRKLELTLPELIECCPTCKYDAITYLEEYKAKRENELNKQVKKNIKSKAQVMWGEFYRCNAEKLEDISSVGKIITISKTIKEDIDLLMKVIEKIKEEGYIPYDRINGSDFIVTLDESDTERIKGLLKNKYAGQFVTISIFLQENI
jgi:DNA polymerase III epsilon subunit-like protein